MLKKKSFENINQAVSIDFKDLQDSKKFFLAVAHLLLRRYKALSSSDKHFYAIVKRSFRTILSNLFDIMDTTVWRALSLVADGMIIDYFKRERKRGRRLKKKRSVRRYRKVPGYMYYTAFLRRIRCLPLAMPKEVSCYKRSVTSNFTYRLYYRHRVKMDARAAVELGMADELFDKKFSRKKRKFKPVTVIPIKKPIKIVKQRSTKRRVVRRISRRRLFSRSLLRNRFLLVGYFTFKNRKGLEGVSEKAFLHYDQRLVRNPLRDTLKKILNNRVLYKWVRGLKKKVQRRVVVQRRRRRRHWHSQAYYRVLRRERKKAWRIKKRKQERKRRKYQRWIVRKHKYWYTKGLQIKRRLLRYHLRLRISGDHMHDIFKHLLITAVLITATQFIIKLYSNPVLGAVPRYVFYKKYYSWFVLLRTRVGRLKWKPKYLKKESKRSRRLLFSCKDPMSKKIVSKEIRLKERNWFVITTKWSRRNFHLNIFSNKHQGGIFKVSSGLLGAKKKRNKRKFRYVRKALHYLLRFLLFYRRRMIKRQKKKFREYYMVLEKWDSDQNRKRFSQRRLFLLDIRRWIRLEKRRLTLHLIIEWFGTEDKYGFYENFIRRLRRIQARMLVYKINRLRRKLRRKKRKYKTNMLFTPVLNKNSYVTKRKEIAPSKKLKGVKRKN